MMRFRMILGGVLMVLAFIFLFGFIVFPVIPQLADSPVFDSILGAVLCAPDQTLVRDQYSQSFGSETQYSMNVACQDAKGNLSDVTDRWGQVGMVGYLVPFLIGLFLFLNGSRGLEDQKKQQKLTQYRRSDIGGVITPEVKDGVLRVGGVDLAVNDFTPDKIADFKRQLRARAGSADNSVRVVTKDTNSSFSDKLKQIQDAHESGLIDDAEYDRLRQKIIDDMK